MEKHTCVFVTTRYVRYCLYAVQNLEFGMQRQNYS